MDEIMSYELSNAEYNPWIVPTQPVGRLAKFMHEEVDGDTLKESVGNFLNTVGDVMENGSSSKLLTYKADVYDEPVWIGRESFKDYVTVDSDDAFNFASVYFNVKDDNHPPVHFMLLHLVSSFARGSMSKYIGCGLNLLILAGTLLIIMATVKILWKEYIGRDTDSIGVEIVSALMYGLSAGTVATTLLIRMYALVAFFVITSLYLHVRAYYYGIKAKKWGLMLSVTVLGFLTQYFFLFYLLPLFIVFVIVLAKEKRLEELKRYVGTMVASGVTGLLLFPFAITDVFGSSRGVEALENLSSGFAGYGTRIAAFSNLLCESIFTHKAVFAFILLAGIYGLYYCLGENKKRYPLCGNLILFVPPVIYFLLAARMSPYIVDRYMMPIFPVVLMLSGMGISTAILRFVNSILDNIDDEKNGRQTKAIRYLGAYPFRAIWFAQKEKPKAEPVYTPTAMLFGDILLTFVGINIVLFFVLGLINYDGEYLYTGYSEQLKVAERYEDLPYIIVYDGYSFYENVPEAMVYEKTLLTKYDELLKRTDIKSDNSYVINVKRYVDPDSVTGFFEKNGYRSTILYGEEQGVFNPETQTFEERLEDVLYLVEKESK